MKNILTSIFVLVFSISANAQVSTTPNGLKIGDKAPNILGKDQNNKEVSLENLLKKEDVVVLFYRGQWCPYCNKQLSNLNDSLSFLTAKGATVIAISPETVANVEKTVAKTKASFSILSDVGLNVSKSYDVNFGVDEKTIEKYKSYGIDFAKANGENGANLPVPATYIIGKDGKIKYAFFNPNYSKRASVKDLIDHL